MKKVWAVLNDAYDLLDYVEADTEDEAVQVFAERERIPKEDVPYLYAIPADGVRDDVEVPGWLLSALEYSPEFAFGPRESSPEAQRQTHPRIPGRTATTLESPRHRARHPPGWRTTT